jgi:hypothetical protein
MQDLSLNFFTSTKGHFGCRAIYSYTLTSLYKKSSIIKNNAYKIAHIKVSPDEIEIGNKIEEDLYKNFNFNKVVKTIGDWSHNNGSSHLEYLKDINTLYSQPELQNIKYGYWHEDDWVVNIDNYDEKVKLAQFLLEKNPNLLTFRYTRVDDLDIKDRTQAIEIGNGLFIQSKEFSFNPTFIRNRDMYFISKFVLKNRFNGHCERDFGLGANYLASNNKDLGFYGDYFSYIDNKIIEHIGCPEAIKKYNIA